MRVCLNFKIFIRKIDWMRILDKTEEVWSCSESIVDDNVAIAISPQEIVREEEYVLDVIITAVEEHINKHWEPSKGQKQPVDSLSNSVNNHESEDHVDERHPIIVSNKQIMPIFHNGDKLISWIFHMNLI